jgi:hypothetical protein
MRNYLLSWEDTMNSRFSEVARETEELFAILSPDFSGYISGNETFEKESWKIVVVVSILFNKNIS